jgi:hypothetical protein
MTTSLFSENFPFTSRFNKRLFTSFSQYNNPETLPCEFIFKPHTSDLDNDQSTNADSDLECNTFCAIFPSTTYTGHEILKSHHTRYADHWPIGFADEGKWTSVWNGKEYEIDQYLRYTQDINTRTLVPWIHEPLYRGAQYRLSIDHSKEFDGLPVFAEGMIIAYQSWNTNDIAISSTIAFTKTMSTSI